LEKPYENALCVELGIRGLPFAQQPRFPVQYKTVRVGEYVPDIIVAGKVVVETKAIDQITAHELGQMLNYLRITRLPIGLIFNFKYARLKWKRAVLSNR
jgi:GxxExxY protein